MVYDSWDDAYGPFYPKPTRVVLYEATGPEHSSVDSDAPPLGPEVQASSNML
jgi:hypothetical protein